jgi:hypothetical protein
MRVVLLNRPLYGQFGHQPL